MNPLKIDPSRTGLIRRAFVADMQRRFDLLRRKIWRLIVTDDVLGLKELTTNAPPFTPKYNFPTKASKIKSFNRWLQHQVNAGILEVHPTVDDPLSGGAAWLYKYVDSAYRKGALRAYTDAHPDLQKPAGFTEGSKAAFLESAFGRPERVDKLKLLYTRAYEDLKGVTSTMSSQLSRTLADGMSAGKGPNEIARTMSKTISGITRKRANVIARTETIHAHAEGQLDGMEDLGIDETEAEVEWSTAGDDIVCPRCREMEGKIFKVRESHGLIPLHPNCVVGSSIIQSPDPLAIMRTYYSGRIINLFTSNGRSLSITENHILLTQRGWVFAKDITELDSLVNAPCFDSAFSSLDQNNIISSIADVFESFAKIYSVRTERIETSVDVRTYLHGDGRSSNQKIDIIGFNCVLGYDFQSQLRGEFKEPPLMLRRRFLTSGLSLSCQRSLSSFFERTASSASSFMRSLGISDVLLARAPFHEDSIRVCLGADGNIQIVENASNNATTDFIKSGDCGFCFARGIPSLDIKYDRRGWCDSGFGVGFREIMESADQEIDSCRFQAIGNNVLSDIQLSGDFSRTLPIFVQLDRVIQIKASFHTDLPVFDVSTRSTMYNLNGVLSSNCRCAWSPVIKVPDLKKLQKKLKSARMTVII